MIEPSPKQRYMARIASEVEQHNIESGQWVCYFKSCPKCGQRMWVEQQAFGATFGAAKAGCCWMMDR